MKVIKMSLVLTRLYEGFNQNRKTWLTVRLPLNCCIPHHVNLKSNLNLLPAEKNWIQLSNRRTKSERFLQLIYKLCSCSLRLS